MSHPHDDDAPVEHDPTGMRDLLAGLPDPGPMPDGPRRAHQAALRPRRMPARLDRAGTVGRDVVPPLPRAGARAAAGTRVVSLRVVGRGGLGVAASPWAGPWLGGSAVGRPTA